MKKVNICYTERANIGDAINPYIIKEVLQYDPIVSDQYHCDITGIGSGLRRFFVNQMSLKMKILSRLYTKPLILWSAGFLTTPSGEELTIRKNIKVASVRGELSRQYVERILGRSIECSTGDGGLLCSKWIAPEPHKIYRIGIIPHVKEKTLPIFNALKNELDDSVIIDVEDDPIKNLKIISACECIISSSLHGLIIADSYNVPNQHIVCSNRLSGDGFKFRDYYSSFSLDDNPLILTEFKKVDVGAIIRNYRITKEIVERKQNDIISAFNLFL